MEENFSPQQSLALIQSMITKTRSSLSENRIYFLLWGWVTFLCITFQFLLKVWLQYPRHYLVWLLTIPTAIITIVYSARQEKKLRVKTYLGQSMGYLWTGIGISFSILSIIVSNLPGGWLNGWPFFILFYALGTFISGKLLAFKPLIIGGIFNWVLCVVCIFLPYDYQLLLAALAVLTSYIIPGHLLRSNN
ncbi:MAG: hypothetical protein V4676_05130 [Bacteroidota bacterium]